MNFTKELIITKDKFGNLEFEAEKDGREITFNKIDKDFDSSIMIVGDKWKVRETESRRPVRRKDGSCVAGLFFTVYYPVEITLETELKIITDDEKMINKVVLQTISGVNIVKEEVITDYQLTVREGSCVEKRVDKYFLKYFASYKEYSDEVMLEIWGSDIPKYKISSNYYKKHYPEILERLNLSNMSKLGNMIDVDKINKELFGGK